MLIAKVIGLPKILIIALIAEVIVSSIRLIGLLAIFSQRSNFNAAIENVGVKKCVDTLIYLSTRLIVLQLFSDASPALMSGILINVRIITALAIYQISLLK